MTARTWVCVSSDSEYTDYESRTPDVNGYGARLCIELRHEDRTAHMSVIVDDVHGERYIDHEDIRTPLPWHIAIAMTKHSEKES